MISRRQIYALTLSSPILFLVVIVVSAQTTDRPILNWQDFKSEAGGFTVKFPGTPKVDTSEVRRGPLTLTRHTHSLELNDLSFDVDYTDMASGVDVDAAMEGGASGLIQSMSARGATVITHENVTQGTCAGKEIVLLTVNPGTTKPGYMHARLFSSGTRFFFLIFVAHFDAPFAREVGRTFLQSFNVTGGCSTLLAPVEAPLTNKTEEILEGSPDAGSGWRIIENPSLGIRVLMPGTVRHISDRPQVDPFPLMHHTYIYSKEGTVYSAEVFGDYPEGFYTTPANYQTQIDITLYALKRNLGAGGFEIRPARDLKIASYPGREFWLTNEKQGTQGRVQIYITPKRTYIFLAFTPVLNPLAPLSQFFSSIRISPK